MDVKREMFASEKAIAIYSETKMLAFSKVLGSAFKKIQSHACKNSLNLKDVPFVKYSVEDWEKTVNMRFIPMFLEVFTKKVEDLCRVVCSRKNVEALDECQELVFESGEYLIIVHKEPYQKVGKAYKEIWNFAKRNKIHLENEAYEFYLNDPHVVKSSDLETRVMVKVKLDKIK
jgi:hypothetical protein